MNIAERVGQLFVVTFPGDDLQRNDAVSDLLIAYKIGGVVLLAANDNISGREGGVPQQVARLTNTLQRAALLGDGAFITATVSIDEGGTPVPLPTPQPVSPGVPLFIVTSQEGDGAPNSNLRTGLTELPSAMAIGATWEPRLAEDMGRLAGRELSALGINMLLGPSLDVLETPDPGNSSDLGTRSFGGSPYWVGQLGQAYTAGVHQGSEDRIAVVAKHFPGQGSSDRPLGEEVSTVQKDLEELQRVDLAPFFAVTGSASSTASTVDALMTTHIRYQGFQGNIRPTTPPVSFDPQALAALMGLAPLDSWRQEGGVLVSDALGVPAVQRFYDDTGQEFPHRRVAKDALLAGNDLLYLGDFAQEPGGFDAQLANIRDTITWFQEKYITDPAFQQRVDDAVLRILKLKLELYGDDFSLDNVLVEEQRQPALAASREADVLQVAQEAITLLAPSAPELAERLPSPPGAADQIVIFTDVRLSRQCRDCPLQPYIGETSLQERILALYGPQASNQIQEEQISSFSFGDLAEFLAAGPGPILPPTPEPTSLPDLAETPEDSQPDETPVPLPSVAYNVQSALDEADWVIFAMLDVTPDVPASNALKRLLAERPDVVRDSRMVVFAYGAPYYLDTTEVSKLAAYYGVYSKSDTFIDTSVRALFQETTLAGAPPVDVPSINYNIEEVTQPDPNQIIGLYVMRDGQPQAPPSEEPLELVVGDTLRLQTGVITDRNQRPVPDGTLVQFIRQDRLEGFISVIGERPTTNGIATLDYVLERRIGQFRITAAAGNATASHQIDIAIDEKASIVAITPTPAPTPTPTLTPTPSPTPTVPASRTPRATATAVAVVPPDEPHLEIGLADFQQLLGLLAGLLLIGGAGWTASGNGHHKDLTARVRLLAWGLMAALLLYNYFALDLPGSQLLDPTGSWAGLLAALAGGVFGLLLGWWQLDHPSPGRTS